MAFPLHAEVRVVIQDLYKIQSGLKAMGLDAPAIRDAMDLLERMSHRLHTLESE